jgi:hypothetical protein
VASNGTRNRSANDDASEADTTVEPRMFNPADPLKDLFESVILEPLAFAASVPDLLAKGRAKIESQTKTANMIGKFVVPIAKRKIDAEIKTLAESVRSYLTSTESKRESSGPSRTPSSSVPATPKPATAKAATPRPATSKPATSKPATSNTSKKTSKTSKQTTDTAGQTSKRTSTSLPQAKGSKPSAPAPKLSGLPIVPTESDLGLDHYDDLPASSVVALLVALTPAQLRAISAYESSHRNRQTILGGVTRLLTAAQ